MHTSHLCKSSLSQLHTAHGSVPVIPSGTPGHVGEPIFYFFSLVVALLLTAKLDMWTSILKHGC